MNSKPNFDNIVFEDRNKAYGAFYLRKYYKNSIFNGFVIASLIFTAGLSFPLIYTKFIDNEVKKEESKVIVVDMVNIEEPIPLPPEPEEIKVPEKAPEVATAKNLELEVKPDEQVQIEEIPPTDEEMKDKQSGTENKEGSDIIEVPKEVEPAPVIKDEAPKIETWAPQMPEFPGGPSELLKFFSEYLEYTPRAEAEGIEGTVRVSFVVNVDGSISDVKIVKGLGYGLDEQVLKAFAKMPKWKPAQKGGKAVPLRMVSPVVFTLY
ncbi:MAG TPA: TonB family protein [Cytophagaceae bacterium]